jgi:hypothetical protein
MNQMTSGIEEQRLGHVETTCAACGREWLMNRGECASCGGHELIQRYVEGTLLERVGGRIMAVVVPAKPASPRASAALVGRLTAVQASIVALLDDLRSLDVQLREAVRADCEALQPAQALVNTALSISGDRSVQRIPGMTLSLESFGASLGTAINNLSIEDKPK